MMRNNVQRLGEHVTAALLGRLTPLWLSRAFAPHMQQQGSISGPARTGSGWTR
jgi:hypothetical protein